MVWKRLDVPTYGAMHRRVNRERGAAVAHSCPCGATAQHWAYQHVAVSPLTDDRGRVYSTDPAHYAPMCIPCHREMDRQHSGRPLAACGTTAGYDRHRREGTTRCRPCKDAIARRERDRLQRLAEVS